MSLMRSLFGRAPAAAAPAATPAPAGPGAAHWRSLGNAALARGDNAEAACCYREAMAAEPSDPLARLNLGFALLQQGQAAEAESHLVQALALKRPGDDFAQDAHFVLAQVLRERGAFDEALAQLDAAIAARADFAEAFEEKADLLLALRRPKEALDTARALKALRATAAADVLASRALFALERHPEALRAIDAALAAEPGNMVALTGRGNVLLELGRAAEALQCFEEVVVREGADADRLANVAAALLRLERFGEARECLAAALAQQPEHRPALVNQVHALRGLVDGESAPAALLAQLAAAHRELGELAQALECADEAIEHDAGLAAAHLERSRALAQLGRNEEAVAACEAACSLDPTAESLGTLAALYARLRLAEEALAASTRAVAADPDDLQARSRELFFSNFTESTQVAGLFERHREYGRMLEARVAPVYADRWTGARDPARRLRIGFVSSDLYRHPAAVFLMPLLDRIDRAQFDVFGYSTSQTIDDTTAQMRAKVSGWVDGRTLSDEQLAARIHADAIDVLVDLSGHSGTPRLGVFAAVPAPVQMTWLGYLNTTGLTRIQYRLCDARTDPPGTQRFNTEQLLPLPASQWCFRPFVQAEPSLIAPSARNGFVTFGSFNNARKISPAMCVRWAQVLARCPGSRLLLADIDSAAKRQRILDAFAREGIAADRLEVLPRADLAGYYRLFDRVDISLDTYPYGGGTTTIDSLWMGVPVVAASGDLPVSRSAASLLQVVGLDDWVAPSVESYVDCAVRGAHDPGALQQLRATLPARVRHSPVMDEAAFARDFGAAVRGAWQRFCAA